MEGFAVGSVQTVKIERGRAVQAIGEILPELLARYGVAERRTGRELRMGNSECGMGRVVPHSCLLTAES
jgi:hypothetical protein